MGEPALQDEYRDRNMAIWGQSSEANQGSILLSARVTFLKRSRGYVRWCISVATWWFAESACRSTTWTFFESFTADRKIDLDFACALSFRSITINDFWFIIDLLDGWNKQPTCYLTAKQRRSCPLIILGTYSLPVPTLEYLYFSARSKEESSVALSVYLRYEYLEVLLVISGRQAVKLQKFLTSHRHSHRGRSR